MDQADIRIVLVAPSHPGNIGAAARAMKNMALGELLLVAPKQFPHAEASARASGADDVLQSARVVGSLAEALAGCGFVAATTSRDRDQYFRVIDVREAAARIVSESRRAPAAVVFGAERTGLTNAELESAHALVRIPASAAYPSLISPWPCSWWRTSCSAPARPGRSRPRLTGARWRRPTRCRTR